jgi:hypothetical protein
MMRRGLQWAASGAVAAALTIAAAGCTGNSATTASMADGAVSASSESSQAAAGDMAGGSADTGSAAGAGAASSAAVPAAPGAAVGYDTAPSGKATSDAPVIASNRQIIRTATVTIGIEVKPSDGEKSVTAADLAQAAQRAARQVRDLGTIPGAYVAGSDGHGSSVTVTLRIPAGSYDDIMGRLGSIGTVTNEAEATEDVTSQLIDVSSRLQTMQASVDRLRALMTDAQSMKDVIALESELTQREADLESLERQQASLKDQVALSTITVTVNADAAKVATAAEPKVERAAFVAGLIAGWHGLQAVGRVVAAVAGALLPFLPAIAVVVALGWLGVRRTRRARAATAAVEQAPQV